MRQQKIDIPKCVKKNGRNPVGVPESGRVPDF
jgi:hypothetical protein